MKNLIIKVVLFSFLCTVTLVGCETDDPETTVDLSTARITSFPLNEVEALTIDIVHPVVVGDNEITPGTIDITVPFAHQSLVLSLKSFELSNAYNISPSVHELQDFSKGEVVYTITSATSPDKEVHYHVTITHGGDPFFENAEITGFSFKKSNNAQFESDIEATKIIGYPNFSSGAIYVVVPEGTDFTTLKPTITFDAAKLYYTAGAETKVYPAEGLTVDFKYPKRFSIQAENSLGEKSQIYDVIVDVKDPIKFEQPTLVTPNVKTGNGNQWETFPTVARWTNVGNHPITGMSAKEYTNKVYPADGYGDLNIITAMLINPQGGLPGVLPGEQGEVSVKVTRVTAGLFSTTAVFKPTFRFDTQVISFFDPGDRTEAIFNPILLKVESTQED